VYLEPLKIMEIREVSGVMLDVAVHDREGLFVTGLSAGDFRLLENGVPQTLVLGQAETLPAVYTLLLDTSQSMARRIHFVRHAAASFVAHLRPRDHVVVAPFSRALGPVTGPTADHQTILDAIRIINSKGGTAILDALGAISDFLWIDDERRHAIILLTDGYDEHSSAELDEALSAVKNLRAGLYVVGVAGSAGISLKGERFLRGLAAETGGRAFFPSREAEVPWVYRRLTEEVQQRYLVGYTPTNQKADGTWRKIELSASDPGWRVRTRPGYFAPRPAPVRPSLEFTVMNTQSEFVGVALDDLVVLEDGVEQTVDTFHEAVAPVSFVLAVDASGSMRRAVQNVKAAARTFVLALRPEDRLALATFADRVLFDHDTTTERSWSLEAIDRYAANGGTALYDALAASMARLKEEATRRVIVAVTDGRDEDNPGTGPGSRHTFSEVVQLVKESKAMVFTIGLGPNVDRPVLEQLSAESGGAAYFPEDVSQLESQYRRVLEHLRRRYVISYSSTNGARDGSWRNVQITTRLPGTLVSAPAGYLAPER
jgi:Ca-activated chloride channel family protein